MAKQVLTNVVVTFGTANTDISQYVGSITLSTTAAEVATTAMGSSAVTRIQGLIDNSITLVLDSCRRCGGRPCSGQHHLPDLWCNHQDWHWRIVST
jgi:hypothetical protein